VWNAAIGLTVGGHVPKLAPHVNSPHRRPCLVRGGVLQGVGGERGEGHRCRVKGDVGEVCWGAGQADWSGYGGMSQVWAPSGGCEIWLG
jgi:hypothetical protein